MRERDATGFDRFPLENHTDGVIALSADVQIDVVDVKTFVRLVQGRAEVIELDADAALDPEAAQILADHLRREELDYLSSLGAEKVKIVCPPGGRLMSIVRFVCSKKTVTRVYKPLYADFWKEYVEAVDAGLKWKACWIRARFYGGFLKTAGFFNLVKLGKQFAEYWKAAS